MQPSSSTLSSSPPKPSSSRPYKELLQEQIAEAIPMMVPGPRQLIVSYCGIHFPDYYGPKYDEKADNELLERAKKLKNSSEGKLEGKSEEKTQPETMETLAIEAVQTGAVHTLHFLLSECGLSTEVAYPLVIRNVRVTWGKFYSYKTVTLPLGLCAIAARSHQEMILRFLLENFPVPLQLVNEKIPNPGNPEAVVSTVLTEALRGRFNVDTIILLLSHGCERTLIIQYDISYTGGHHVFPAFILFQSGTLSEEKLFADVQKLYDYLTKSGNPVSLLNDKIGNQENAIDVAIRKNQPSLVAFFLLLLSNHEYPLKYCQKLSFRGRSPVPETARSFHQCNQLFLQASEPPLLKKDFPFSEKEVRHCESVFGTEDLTYIFVKGYAALFADRSLPFYKRPSLWQQYSKTWETPGDFQHKALTLLRERQETEFSSAATDKVCLAVKEDLSQLPLGYTQETQNALWRFIENVCFIANLEKVNPKGDFFTRFFFICMMAQATVRKPVQVRESKDFHSYSSFFDRPTPDRTKAIQDSTNLTPALIKLVALYVGSYFYEEKTSAKLKCSEEESKRCLERAKATPLGSESVRSIAASAAQWGLIDTLKYLLTRGDLKVTDPDPFGDNIFFYLLSIAIGFGQESTVRYLLEEFPEGYLSINNPISVMVESDGVCFTTKDLYKTQTVLRRALAQGFEASTLLLLIAAGAKLKKEDYFGFLYPSNPSVKFYRGLFLLLQISVLDFSTHVKRHSALETINDILMEIDRIHAKYKMQPLEPDAIKKLFLVVKSLCSESIRDEPFRWVDYTYAWQEHSEHSGGDLRLTIIMFLEIEGSNNFVVKNTALYKKILNDLYENPVIFSSVDNLLGYLLNLFPEHYKYLINEHHNNTHDYYKTDNFFAKLFFVGCKVIEAYFKLNPVLEAKEESAPVTTAPKMVP